MEKLTEIIEIKKDRKTLDELKLLKNENGSLRTKGGKILDGKTYASKSPTQVLQEINEFLGRSAHGSYKGATAKFKEKESEKPYFPNFPKHNRRF